MSHVLILAGTSCRQFQVDYPYYGMFSKAQVTEVSETEGKVFQCCLLNGSVLLLRKAERSNKWIDTSLNLETPLSSVIGTSIDDFLKVS